MPKINFLAQIFLKKITLTAQVTFFRFESRYNLSQIKSHWVKKLAKTYLSQNSIFELNSFLEMSLFGTYNVFQADTTFRRIKSNSIKTHLP